MNDRQMLAKPVGWVEIYVAEMDREKDFYEEVVGATARGSEIYVEKQSVGQMGLIAIIGESEGNSIGVHSWV